MYITCVFASPRPLFSDWSVIVLCSDVERRDARIDDVYGRTGRVRGVVCYTHAQIAAQHGALDADQRTGQNLPLPPAAHNQL